MPEMISRLMPEAWETALASLAPLGAFRMAAVATAMVSSTWYSLHMAAKFFMHRVVAAKASSVRQPFLSVFRASRNGSFWLYTRLQAVEEWTSMMTRRAELEPTSMMAIRFIQTPDSTAS